MKIKVGTHFFVQRAVARRFPGLTHNPRPWSSLVTGLTFLGGADYYVGFSYSKANGDFVFIYYRGTDLALGLRLRSCANGLITIDGLKRGEFMNFAIAPYPAFFSYNFGPLEPYPPHTLPPP